MKNLLLFVLLALASTSVYAQDGQRGTISLKKLGNAYTQNFNRLATAGASTAVPTGWHFVETGPLLDSNYEAWTGSNTSGNTYSFGTGASAERAFGSIETRGPTGVVPTIGAQFTNNTRGTIISLAISYTGEQWRLGTASRTDQINFEYSTDATSLTTGTWTAVNALNFVTPNTETVGPKDGNHADNRTAISHSITGLTILKTSSFWIRWHDADASGADDALSVDDFSLTPFGPAADKRK